VVCVLLLTSCRGAGGLGCEILKNLALSGFKDVHVIDMGTLETSSPKSTQLTAHRYDRRLEFEPAIPFSSSRRGEVEG